MGELTINPVFNVYKKYRKVNLVNPYIVTPIYTDADVIAFISASGITDRTQKDALNYLIVNLKINSLWSKMQAVYPMVGITADNHKWNAKNSLNTDAGFRINWVGTGTHDANGYTPSIAGISYGDTFLIPSITQNVNSNGISISLGTTYVLNNTNFEIGAFISGTQRSSFSGATTGGGLTCRFNGSNMLSANTEPRGVYTAQRTAATVSNSWKAGVKKQTSNSGGTLPTCSFYIGAQNGNGTPGGFATARIQSTFIHEGLTDAEVPILHTIIDAYENMLGRKTW